MSLAKIRQTHKQFVLLSLYFLSKSFSLTFCPAQEPGGVDVAALTACVASHKELPLSSWVEVPSPDRSLLRPSCLLEVAGFGFKRRKQAQVL